MGHLWAGEFERLKDLDVGSGTNDEEPVALGRPLLDQHQEDLCGAYHSRSHLVIFTTILLLY